MFFNIEAFTLGVSCSFSSLMLIMFSCWVFNVLVKFFKNIMKG